MNETLKAFQYPKMLIKEYENWCLLIRKKQVTIGSLVLICKENATAFSNISRGASEELHIIIKEVENNLWELYKNEKINYLMLMMVDPNVHYHIIPRFSKSINILGRTFKDYSWPYAPDLTKHNEVDDKTLKNIKIQLKSKFLIPPERKS